MFLYTCGGLGACSPQKIWPSEIEFGENDAIFSTDIAEGFSHAVVKI